MNGLDWQVIQLQFAAGLNQRFDDRARQPPYLDICRDVQFDEIGGLQTRYPYTALGSSIVGGGTISDARRMYRNGDELVLFTKTGLYSYNAQLSKWSLKGTHLATKIDEKAVFVNTADQIHCDRAELNGTIVYCWVEGTVGATSGYIAAVDKTTGSVTVQPTSIANCWQPRLIALDTKILFFFIQSGDAGATRSDLNVMKLDPADVATSLLASPTIVLASPDVGACYDVARSTDTNGPLGVDSAILGIRRATTTSYTIASVTAALVVAAVTKARVCDGPIAVAPSPNGQTVQIIRGNATAVEGDLVEQDGFDDLTTAQAVGTTTTNKPRQIAACHSSTAVAGQYTCHVFWHAGPENSGEPTFVTKHNTVTTGGTIGTQANMVREAAVASRAFEYDGRVYVNLVFASPSGITTLASLGLFRTSLQNSYFTYRDDGLLVAKSAYLRAGGFQLSEGTLPHVELTEGTTGYSWAGTERRIVPMTHESSTYADRGPRDIKITFDSNEARRAVRLGRTLYITGGEIMQYDGTRLVEVGFHVFPHYGILAVLASGNLEAGAYAYKPTYRYDNSRGERERSTTASHGDVTIAGGAPDGVSIASTPPLHITHKYATDPTAPADSPPPPAVEWWRTRKNPDADSPFHLVTSLDPSDVTNPNRYLANDALDDALDTVNDEYSDTTLLNQPTSDENGGILPSIAPPAATIIIASDTRLFLAGIAGDPDRVWYSLQRDEGEIASFSDALTIQVPSPGGKITALAFRNRMLVVFRETAAYLFAGFGFDDSGQGQNFELVDTPSTDTGAVNHESVADTDRGVIFKSIKGWMILPDGGGSPQYIGAPVSDYDAEVPVAVHVLEGKHQIRCLTAERMLVLDTIANQWGEHTINDGLHAAIWNGAYHYLAATGPKAEGATYSGLTYAFDIETTWIKPADLQGSVRVRWLQLLGEWVSAHHMRIRIAYDYVDTYVDDFYWTTSPAVAGPLQVKPGPSRQQCQAFKLRLTPVSATNHANPPSGAAAKLTGLGVELGYRKGLYRRLPAAQKAGLP